MPATRVIIDMQEDFSAACRPEVICGVKKEIEIAILENAPIIIVEYIDCGKTRKEIIDLVDCLDLAVKVKKSGDCGTRVVLNAIKKNKFPSDHIRVCGVNTDWCVRETVNGLLRSLKETKIELVKSACGDNNVYYNWEYFTKHQNLELV